MNNSLPNTSLFFDSSKKDDMQAFLERIYGISAQNSIVMNGKTVYNQLRTGLLPEKEIDPNNPVKGIDNRQFFQRWINEFKSKRNINCFCDEINWPYWLQFVNGYTDGNDYIKLYIPINNTHLFRGVSELFSFLDKEKINHLSKVASNARLDNVIIRLDKEDKKSLAKIIDFINKNKYLKTGLNDNNPFVPSISGIGVMNEHGNSYNSDISEYIANYINQCVMSKTTPNIDEFRNYVKTYCSDKDLVETFENAYLGRTKYKTKNERNYDFDLTLEQKTYLLIDALKATYMKYGIDQAEGALIEAAKTGDFKCFTNGGALKLRTKLKNSISKEDIMQIVKYALPNFVGAKRIIMDKDKKLSEFVNILFQDQLVLSLDESCIATLEKYSPDFLKNAIVKYIRYGDANGFTRFGKGDGRTNYREQIMKIGRDRLTEYMKKSIQLRGYNLEDVQGDLVTAYVSMLERSRYTTLNDSPIISR